MAAKASLTSKEIFSIQLSVKRNLWKMLSFQSILKCEGEFFCTPNQTKVLSAEQLLNKSLSWVCRSKWQQNPANIHSAAVQKVFKLVIQTCPATVKAGLTFSYASTGVQSATVDWLWVTPSRTEHTPLYPHFSYEALLKDFNPCPLITVSNS